MTTLEGGCHCGALRYTMRGQPMCVNCCHCRDCQTLSGSAFALNAMIEADRVALTQGVPAVDATDAGAVRCGDCSVLLWGTHPMFGAAVAFVRVGTLDTGEVIAPDAHFFVRSKHPWVTIPDGVRSYETLPGPDDAFLDAEAQTRVAAVMRQR